MPIWNPGVMILAIGITPIRNKKLELEIKPDLGVYDNQNYKLQEHAFYL